jgi:hypothetical protein
MYCLSKHQAATTGLLHIVAKFYMNIMQIRPSEIYTRQFPRIRDGILADTQTSQVQPTPEPIKKYGKLGTQRKHTNYRKMFTIFTRRTYTYTCDVCNKTLRISM